MAMPGTAQGVKVHDPEFLLMEKVLLIRLDHSPTTALIFRKTGTGARASVTAATAASSCDKKII